MRSKTLVLAAAVAAITIAAAAGRSPKKPRRSEADLKTKIAALQGEVARLRGGRGVSDVEGSASRAKEASFERPALPEAGREAPLPSKNLPALLRSRSRAERGQGLKALGELPRREEKLAFLRELLEGADTGMKSRALSHLKAVGGAEAVALAAGVLQAEGPSWLRSQAASVLGDLGDAAALAPLLDASRSQDLQVRAGAGEALDRLGHAAPLQELIATLAEMLDHPDGRMRQDALDLLSTFRNPAVIPSLAKALGDRTNSRIREEAANALGQTRLAEAVPHLEGALNDPEPGVREAAKQALAALRASGN